jgi:hypothetical protein
MRRRRLIPEQVVSDLLRHPLFLLLATALISGLLVPFVASGWQRQQKENELNTVLVGEMADSVARILIATQFAVLSAPSQSPADFDNAYKNWEISRVVIKAKILGVTRKPGLAEEWDKFGERVTRFYAITAYHESPQGVADLNAIARGWGDEALTPPHENNETDAIDHPREQSAWVAARTRLVGDLGNLIAQVLE